MPIQTLCPCSKEISKYGAHNQRAIAKLEIRSHELVWLEPLKLLQVKAPAVNILKQEMLALSGECARPGATSVNLEEEQLQVVSAIKQLRNKFPRSVISIANRLFVLEPLNELAPNLFHHVLHKTMRELYEKLRVN